jgi:hypothetical protein
MKKNIKNSHLIINLGSATTLTLGTRGGNSEARRENIYGKISH